MASNAETIENLKNSIVSLKDNPNAIKAMSKFEEQRARLVNFIKKNKTYFIVAVVIITILSIYIFVFYNRVNNYFKFSFSFIGRRI